MSIQKDEFSQEVEVVLTGLTPVSRISIPAGTAEGFELRNAGGSMQARVRGVGGQTTVILHCKHSHKS